MALADESSPVYLQGAFQVISSVLKDEPKVREAFRNGNGVAWSEHDPGLFEGTERFFRPGYRANLVRSWIPALDGVEAKLAVGYTLDELPNDITKTTPASFEPTIDYVVVKMPRWTFEKFPDCDETLTTQMKSVGEAMAIGRTFKEAFQKCIRSMEIQRYGFGLDDNDAWLKALRGDTGRQLPIAN